MLDTYGRKFVQPSIEITAKCLLKLRFTPNSVTYIAFIIGISSSLFAYYNLTIIALLVLWLSGYLDAVDGTMARILKCKSPWGTVLDITFDRIVEYSIIFILSLKYSSARISLIVLTGSILLSMTIFLTVGALAENNGVKSFYYQAGLAERSEGFIFFSLMIIFQNNYLIPLSYIFSAIIIFTALQRFLEARRIFK